MDNDDDLKFNELDARIDQIRQRLRDDGPDVDHAAIDDYIDGELSADQQEAIEELIYTWRRWYDAYWESRAFSHLPDDWETSNPAPVRPQGPEEGAADSAPKDTPSWRRRRRYIGWIAAVAAALVIMFSLSGFLSDAAIDGFNDNGRRYVAYASGEKQGIENLPAEWRADARLLLEKEDPMAIMPSVDGAIVRGSAFYIAPSGTRVRSTRPRFSWNEYPAVDEYQLYIYENNQAKTQEEEDVKPDATARVTYLDCPTELKEGTLYGWEIKVVRNGEVKRLNADRPVFRVLDDASLEAVKRLEADANGSHILLAIGYLSFGLKDDAVQEIKELQTKNPDSQWIGRLLEKLGEE